MPPAASNDDDPLRADLKELTATLKLVFLQQAPGAGAVPLPVAPAPLPNPLVVAANGQTQPQRLAAPPIASSAPPPPDVDEDDVDAAEAEAETAADALPQKKRTRSATKEMITRINSAIDAIINYNNAPDRLHSDKWAITINALKAFASSAPSMINILNQRKKRSITTMPSTKSTRLSITTPTVGNEGLMRPFTWKSLKSRSSKRRDDGNYRQAEQSPYR